MFDKLSNEYDEVSPITGNKCVLCEADPNNGMEHRLCMESGYTNHTSWIEGSEELNRFDSSVTSLMRDLKHKDSAGSVWYPLSISTQKLIFYPAGSLQEWGWMLTPVKELSEEERVKYPVPGKEGVFYDRILDFENSEVFTPEQFPDAFARFYDCLYETEK